MQALIIIIVNLMGMGIYVPYLLDKERKYNNPHSSETQKK